MGVGFRWHYFRAYFGENIAKILENKPKKRINEAK